MSFTICSLKNSFLRLPERFCFGRGEKFFALHFNVIIPLLAGIQKFDGRSRVPDNKGSAGRELRVIRRMAIDIYIRRGATLLRPTQPAPGR
jgi:hypothetical protein